MGRRFARLTQPALVLAFLLVAFPLRADEPPYPVIIHGSEALSLEVLLEVLDVDPSEPLSEELAEQLRRRLTHYYHGRGYTLARVWSRIHEGCLYLTIDEGKLEKIIVRGSAGGITALMVRWLVELPYDVYNEPLLNTQLDIIRQRFGISEMDIEIWRSPRVRQVGFQLSAVDRNLFSEEVATWELHLVLAPSRGSGPSIGVLSSPDYGVTPYAQYNRAGVFFADNRDRLGLLMETGYYTRRDLNRDRYVLRLTHVQLGARYDFPAIGGVLRFFTDNHVQTSSYQRPDLPLDEYWRFTVHNSANIGLDLTRGFTISFGGGLEHTSLFGIKPVAGRPFEISPFSNERYFATAGFDLNLTPDEVRLDQQEILTARYCFYHLDISRWHRLSATYRRHQPIGYHDFILAAQFLYTFGATPFYDEVSLGGPLMRSFFKGRYYVDRAGWMTMEMRASLWKDIIKIGIYHDLAVFGRITHDPKALGRSRYTLADEVEEYALANSFGPGFHWLVFDTFQFNFYTAFGFAPHGFDISYYFTFRKVFF